VDFLFVTIKRIFPRWVFSIFAIFNIQRFLNGFIERLPDEIPSFHFRFILCCCQSIKTSKDGWL
jgi:hypothetical protein